MEIMKREPECFVKKITKKRPGKGDNRVEMLCNFDAYFQFILKKNFFFALNNLKI